LGTLGDERLAGLFGDVATLVKAALFGGYIPEPAEDADISANDLIHLVPAFALTSQAVEPSVDAHDRSVFNRGVSLKFRLLDGDRP